MNQQPNMKLRLSLALLFSVLAHAVFVAGLWIYPMFATAIGLRHIEFVDEDYDRSILVTFAKPLPYPPGYLGFQAPQQVSDLDKVKAEEERRRKLEAKRRARERERAEVARREAEERAKAEQAKNEATPKPTPHPDGYGSFGKINTAPIKDQIQKLYEAKQAGTLVFDGGRIRVGAEGRVKPDGSLTDYRITDPSGNPEIDRAAKVILDAISDSHAVGPLHELTSLHILLDIGETAQLTISGYTSTEQAAADLVNVVNAALLIARFKKSDDPGVIAILNNLKVSRTGQLVKAHIIMPRQMASETLEKTMKKEKS